MTSQIRVSAPGKIILSGEHSVVYGYPALVASVSLRAEVMIEKSNSKLDIKPKSARKIVLRGIANYEKLLGRKVEDVSVELSSRIPIGSGMGSSAAVAVALATALNAFYLPKPDQRKIDELLTMSENYYHKNSSGVDAAIVTNGGYLWYRKETLDFKIISKIKSKSTINNVLIVNTGRPKETTGEMVGLLAHRYKRNRRKVNFLFTKIEEITRDFLKYINKEEDYELKSLIRDNEKCLEELGVVSQSTKQLIRKIEMLGGSAKISGAGGRKGASGMLIVYCQNKEKLADLIKKEKLTFVDIRFGTKGVKIEKQN